jgi:hypothetical protein
MSKRAGRARSYGRFVPGLGPADGDPHVMLQTILSERYRRAMTIRSARHVEVVHQLSIFGTHLGPYHGIHMLKRSYTGACMRPNRG